MVVNGTDVTVTGIENISEQEILAYMDFIHRDNQRDEIESLEISAAEGDNVALDYTLRPPKFQRIRRITGYLVGTLDRFNNAKRAEEKDRVKHEIILDECDCYFKRGFSTEENLRRLSPEQQEKMHALGLYISYGKAPLPNPQSGNSKRMAGLDGFGYRVKPVLKPQYPPQGFERPPRGLSQKPTIIFSARLWDPGDVEERYWEDRIAINTMRIGVVRTLRAAFGNCFIGASRTIPMPASFAPTSCFPSSRRIANGTCTPCITRTSASRQQGFTRAPAGNPENTSPPRRQSYPNSSYTKSPAISQPMRTTCPSRRRKNAWTP